MKNWLTCHPALRAAQALRLLASARPHKRRPSPPSVLMRQPACGWGLLAVVVGLVALLASPAEAAVNCSLSAQGFTSVYDPLSTVPNDNVSSVTINCTRTSADATTITYSLAANNGLYPNGQNNRARVGATNNYLKYDVYKDAGYSTRWGNSGGGPITGNLVFGSATSASLTLPYYNRVGAGQSAVVGDYTDTITTTLTYPPTATSSTSTTASMPVLITTNPQCQFSTPPGTVSFNYTSFQTGPSAATTPFAARCTSGVSYTMSLSPTSGSLLDLSYTLSLVNSVGSTVLSTTTLSGTGAAQDYLVNGSIVANQTGSCASGTCTATSPHTITITY